jgi:hypothetical protein
MTVIPLGIRKSISIQLIIIIINNTEDVIIIIQFNKLNYCLYNCELCNNSNCHRGVLKNVTEENVPRSEHVIIPADNIRSRCTSCGGTIVMGGADTEQCKIAKAPRRNSETNRVQNGGAKFGSRMT